MLPPAAMFDQKGESPSPSRKVAASFSLSWRQCSNKQQWRRRRRVPLWVKSAFSADTGSRAMHCLGQMRRLDLVTPCQVQARLFGPSSAPASESDGRPARSCVVAASPPSKGSCQSQRSWDVVQPAVVPHLPRPNPCTPGASAFASIRVPANRAACRARAAFTRLRIAADGSPSRSSDSFSYSTRGTSIWISIRSSSGPGMRFW